MKFSQAISHISWLNITDVSETIYVPIIRGLCHTLVMGTEMVPEVLVILNQLTWLILLNLLLLIEAITFWLPQGSHNCKPGLD
jgi:hypothetical protein